MKTTVKLHPTADDENCVVSIGTATAFSDGGDEDDSDKDNVESKPQQVLSRRRHPHGFGKHIAFPLYFPVFEL